MDRFIRIAAEDSGACLKFTARILVQVARIMMNAELVSRAEQRIIIPTVYRENYLSALKSLSNRGSSEPLIRMLDFAQRFTTLVDWRSFEFAKAELKSIESVDTPQGPVMHFQANFRVCPGYGQPGGPKGKSEIRKTKSETNSNEGYGK